ncbi:hypothetical protein L484_011389 [Morus notabilis]|uniref:Phorbol-ester/DAG-type domain-containing protein n=1 Tax=Morus notabilis TaxID=981085 RepID=W9QX91_9ROSA|nr:hypothetical protein L484_011389 [Morus notabilis]
MNQIEHWSHQQHPLLLRKDEQQGLPTSFTCEICDEYSVAVNDELYYVCDSCKFYVHKSCAESPRQINHYFHPSHPLTLFTRRNYYCDSCHQYFTNAVSFKCAQCNFDMDVKCALMPPITCESQEHIQHFSHQHPLPLVQDVDNRNKTKLCFVCHLTCSSGTDYGCTKCRHFLHKSCAELPREIKHSVHPNHGLLALGVTHAWFTCSLCDKKDGQTLLFKCRQCTFQLCVKCGMTVKGINSIRYEDHEHLLCFLENTYNKLGLCNSYDAYCKHPVLSNATEFSHTQCSIFRCLDCDFKVHLLCGPLPAVIQYEYHKHPLILVDSLEEDNSGEYYCDVCETERDPRIRLYYCEECKFFAHVHCVMSEMQLYPCHTSDAELINYDQIIKVLKGDLSNVELKTIGADFWNFSEEAVLLAEKVQAKSSVTFKDLLNTALSEAQWLTQDFKWDASSHEENKGQQAVSQSTADQLNLTDDHINELLRLCRYTEVDFSNFTNTLKGNFYSRWLKINSGDLALKVIDIEGYKVPFTLAPVLKVLLRKYKDICLHSEKSLAVKSIALSFLCKVVKQMHSTRVQDITKDLLQDWYFYVEFSDWRVSLKVNFLKQYLEKITRAFFGLQLKKVEADVPTILSKKIDELKHLRLQYETKLQECQKFRQTSPKPKFVNECLNEATKLEWKTAIS